MGVCAIRGPLVMHPDECGEESPKSTWSRNSSDESSSQDLNAAEAADQYDEDPAIWMRRIPRGRRCKPLSFSGIISYDENGNQLEIHHEELEEEPWCAEVLESLHPPRQCDRGESALQTSPENPMFEGTSHYG